MKPDKLQRLVELVDLIDTRLAKVPDVDWQDRETWNAAREAEKQILVDLQQSEGASFTDDYRGAALKLAGIRATCTAGAAGVLRNWQKKARKAIEQARAA